MTKLQFLLSLHNKLSGLPKNEIEERLNFYSEMIEDRIEDGLSEEKAVSDIGTVDEIAEQIVSDIPLTKIAKEKIKPKRRIKAWEVILLILGAPLWLSILIAIFAVIFSLYISLWAVIVSLWASFVAVIGSALGGIMSGIVLGIYKNALTGVALISAGLVCIGLSILFFYGCKVATKGILLLTKKIILALKKSFIKKGEE
ncbi:MAG: DUF1700 domain-containing protein [Clostridia bacterium]|nr:DUF1700 domain-containing protein [Clostridia bacterium]